MLWLVSCIKLLAEVALMAYAGRAVLGLLAGAGAHDNPVHRLFCAVTRLPEQGVRRLARGRVPARTLPRWTCALALLLWVLAAGAKLAWCVDGGKVVCP